MSVHKGDDLPPGEDRGVYEVTRGINVGSKDSRGNREKTRKTSTRGGINL